MSGKVHVLLSITPYICIIFSLSNTRIWFFEQAVLQGFHFPYTFRLMANVSFWKRQISNMGLVWKEIIWKKKKKR